MVGHLRAAHGAASSHCRHLDLFLLLRRKVGSTELKISHIARNAFMLSYVVASGISQTTRTVVSQLIGASRTADLTPALKRLATLNLVGVIIMSHGFILYPDAISQIFFDDPESIASMSRTFTTLFIAVIGFSISSLLLATLEGSGGTKRAFLVEMIGAGTYLAAVFYLTSPMNDSMSGEAQLLPDRIHLARRMGLLLPHRTRKLPHAAQRKMAPRPRVA